MVAGAASAGPALPAHLPPAPTARRRMLFAPASFRGFPPAHLFSRLRLAVVRLRRVGAADLDSLVLGKMRRLIGLAALAHGHGIDASRRAAQDALRAGAAMVHHHRDASLAAAQFYGVVDAEAAAEFAGAARAFAQREFLEQHGIELLQHLDRRHLGDADGRASVAQAAAALDAADT